MAENLGFGASNPYLQPAIDGAQGDMVRNFNLSVTPSIRSAMARSGSFGNSGLEQMAGEAERTLQSSLGRVGSEMRYGDYWNNQNLNKSIYDTTFNQQQQQFGNAMNLLGMQNGMGQQNLGLTTGIQNTPLNYWSQMGNQANAFGQGFGTSTGSTSMPGSPLMGAMGGWQLGSQFGKSMAGTGGGGGGGWNYSLDNHFGGFGTGGD